MKIYFLCSLLLFSIAVNAQTTNAKLVKDITTGTASSFTDSDDKIVGHLGDKLFFVTRDNNFISHLFVTEGAAASTIELQTSASQNERFVNFLKVNSTTMVYVLYNQFNLTYKSYSTDGTAPTLLSAHNANKSIINLHYFNGYLYYNTSNEFRRIDLANTVDEQVLQLGFFDNIVDFYLEGNDQLYYAFKATDEEEQDTLVLYNTTLETTDTLSPIGQSIAWGLNFQKVNGKLLLFNKDENGLAYLYATSGTETSTSLLKTFAWQGIGICNVQAIVGNQLYFDAALDPNDPNAGYVELFVSDGTVAGTYTLSSSASAFKDPRSLIKYGDGVYFQATPTDDIYGNLYTSDGTTGGTTKRDFIKNYYGSEGLARIGNIYYAAGFYSQGENVIWAGNDIEQPVEGDVSVYPYDLSRELSSTVTYENQLYATDNEVYFIGQQDEVGKELYLFTHGAPIFVTSSLESSTNKMALNSYPNPVTDQFKVEYTGTDEIIGLSLRTINGKLVNQTFNQTEMDLTGQPSGLYILEVELKNSTQVLKIIKK